MIDTTRFRAGINLPWIHYGGDFGANHWQPAGGLASRGIPDNVKQLFERLSLSGATLVRWFLFTDGRAGIRFSGDEPLGLDDFVLRDVEAALDAARTSGIELLFTLFDFHWCDAARMEGGVQLGGHAPIVTNNDLRTALLENVLAPLFRTVGAHPHIAGWDVINEPEWVTNRVRRWFGWSHVPRRHMRRFIADVATLAHALTPHPVTVGSASAQWLWLVEDLDLDFYQVHWYDQIDGSRPPDSVDTSLLRKPIMLGEFPTKQSGHQPDAFVEMARRGGYFAALPWSALATDNFSCGADDICGMFEEPRKDMK